MNFHRLDAPGSEPEFFDLWRVVEYQGQAGSRTYFERFELGQAHCGRFACGGRGKRRGSQRRDQGVFCPLVCPIGYLSR
jgi:hypothetical protein